MAGVTLVPCVIWCPVSGKEGGVGALLRGRGWHARSGMGCDSIRFSRTAELVLFLFSVEARQRTGQNAVSSRMPVEGEGGLVVSAALGVKPKVSA